MRELLKNRSTDSDAAAIFASESRERDRLDCPGHGILPQELLCCVPAVCWLWIREMICRSSANVRFWPES